MGKPDDFALELAHIDTAIEEAQIIEARESFPAFCEYAMIDADGKRWKFAPHQHEWSNRFDDESLKLLLTIGPRGSAKSTTMQARALFELGKNPNTCIKYVCGSDDKAIDRLRFIRNNIISNTRYHRVFPHVKPAEVEAEWTKHKAFIERPAAAGIQDASVECSSVTASGTGGRAHILMFDDIVDATSALIRPKVMAQVKQIVENDWMNLLFPGGRAFMIGTFWSFDPPDIYVEYSERPEWNPWIKPACDTDANGTLCGPFLWPDRWGKEELEDRRHQSGEEAFQQQYLLRGSVVRSQFFSAEHITSCKAGSVSLGDTPFEIEKTVMGVDPAASLKKTGSYSCIFVVGVGQGGQKIPLAIYRERCDAELLADTVLQLWIEYGCDKIIVENNATQQMLVSLIRVIGEKYGHTDLPLEGRFTGTQKWSPEAGLPKLNAELAQNKWVIPFAGNHNEPHHKCIVCAWIDEMTYWGKLRMPNGQKPTTDIIMAWWMASAAADNVGHFGALPIIGSRQQRQVQYGSQGSFGRAL